MLLAIADRQSLYISVKNKERAVKNKDIFPTRHACRPHQLLHGQACHPPITFFFIFVTIFFHFACTFLFVLKSQQREQEEHTLARHATCSVCAHTAKREVRAEF